MDWKKLSPWNWLKHEEDNSTVPVRSSELVPRTFPSSVSTLHDEIDRVFDNVFRGFGVAPLRSSAAFPSALCNHTSALRPRQSDPRGL